MAKTLELNRWDAFKRLSSFLKLRKGKAISDKMLKDFERLLDSMDDNFKGYNSIAVTKNVYEDMDIRLRAIKALKSNFITFEKGGYFRKDDIQIFSYYKDETHKVTINNIVREITENDFKMLEYIFK